MSGSNEQGFGLLEALVGLALVSIVALGAVSAAAADLRAAAAEVRTLEASALAEYQMSRLRLGMVGPGLPADTARDGRFPEPFAGYVWRTEHGFTVDGRFQELTVSVAWPGGSFALERRLTVRREVSP